MKNITLAIEEEVLDKVRVVAAEKRTTVNAMVREYLMEIASRNEKIENARRKLLELMEQSKGDMGPLSTFVWSYNLAMLAYVLRRLAIGVVAAPVGVLRLFTARPLLGGPSRLVAGTDPPSVSRRSILAREDLLHLNAPSATSTGSG